MNIDNTQDIERLTYLCKPSKNNKIKNAQENMKYQEQKAQEMIKYQEKNPQEHIKDQNHINCTMYKIISKVECTRLDQRSRANQVNMYKSRSRTYCTRSYQCSSNDLRDEIIFSRNITDQR